MIEILDPVVGGMKFYDHSQLGVRAPLGSIFVFGANLKGAHGKGAALYARQHYGAIYGKGVGLQGNSYAIPTKDAEIKTLPMELIESYVEDFVRFTHRRPELHFYVTAVGTGLAGMRHDEMGPLFRGAVRCWMPLCWKQYLV